MRGVENRCSASPPPSLGIARPADVARRHGQRYGCQTEGEDDGFSCDGSPKVSRPRSLSTKRGAGIAPLHALVSARQPAFTGFPTALRAAAAGDHPRGCAGRSCGRAGRSRRHCARAPALDRIHDLHSFDHLPDHGVIPVEERARFEHDEELRIGACRGSCARAMPITPRSKVMSENSAGRSG